MSLKKQITLFAVFCLIFASLYAAFNILIDPFGVFGDPVFDYYEYNMTQNPRVAKIAYIDKHGDEYDSYIFGCSKSSSYPVEELNKYLDAEFFNMFAYGGDLYDIELMAKYVIENKTVKNLVLAIGPEAAYRFGSEEDALKDNLHAKVDSTENPMLFYAKYMFLNPAYAMDKLRSYLGRGYLPDASNVFIEDSGAYNKSRRDIMPISDIESYMALAEEGQFNMTHSRPLSFIDEAVGAVRSIKDMCDERGINFILIGSPLYDGEIECYEGAELAELTTKIAQVTDFYNFWGYNAFSHDERYFYDGYHFRNALGSAALAYIFGNERIALPESFGRLTTTETVDRDLAEMCIRSSGEGEAEALKLPILMYHALTEDDSEASDTIITANGFEAQIKSLSEEGYTALFYEDILSFAKEGKTLPEKPIIITFDDGYSSNLEIALPILQKYGFCATTSVIGVSIGKDSYKDTGVSMYPHFGIDDARKAYEGGIFDFQSHTYDMHQNINDADPRDGVLIKTGESEDEYISALSADASALRDSMKSIGNEIFVITYPHGKYSELSEAVLCREGFGVSVGVEYGINEIIPFLPQSLRGLKRINMTDGTSGEALIAMLNELGA